MKRFFIAAALFAGFLFGDWQAAIDSTAAGRSFVRPAAAYNDDAYHDFDQSMRPYGQWVVTPQWGHVWIPAGVPRGWRPYSDGHWDYTDDYGWVWVSDQEWGWAPFHYGRWALDARYGWVWVPGRVWGPAWVSFRYGDAYVGWAPLPPEGDDYDYVPRYGYEPTIAVFWWNFVPRQRFNDRNVNHYYDYHNNENNFHRTKNVTNITVINNRVVNNSVDVREFEQATRQRVVRHRVDVTDSVVPVNQRSRGNDIVLIRPKAIERNAPPPKVQGGQPQPTGNQPNGPATTTGADHGKPTGGNLQKPVQTEVLPPAGKPGKNQGNVNQPGAGSATTTGADHGKPTGGNLQKPVQTEVLPPAGKPGKNRGNVNQPGAGPATTTGTGHGKPTGGNLQKPVQTEVLPPSGKPGKIQGNVNPPPPDNAKPKKPPENDCSGQQAGSKGCPKP